MKSMTGESAYPGRSLQTQRRTNHLFSLPSSHLLSPHPADPSQRPNVLIRFPFRYILGLVGAGTILFRDSLERDTFRLVGWPVLCLTFLENFKVLAQQNPSSVSIQLPTHSTAVSYHSTSGAFFDLWDLHSFHTSSVHRKC